MSDILSSTLNEKPFQLIIAAPSGCGKSTVVRHLLNTLNYDILLVISEECQEGGEYSTLDPSVTVSYFDIDRLKSLQTRDQRKKLVVLDDVIGMHLRDYKLSRFLDGFSSNARHFNISIISSVQTLTGLPVSMRLNCNNALFNSVEDLTKKLYKNIIGKNLSELDLPQYTFLYINKKGGQYKIRIS